MKKVLLTLALAAFAFAANAQYVIGGQLSVNHNGTNNGNYPVGSNATTGFEISPKVGYNLNETFQVGLQLNYAYNNTINYGGASNTYTSNPRTQFGIAPYVRWNFATWRNCTLFVEGQLVFAMAPESKTHNYINGNEVGVVNNADDMKIFGATVIPGLNYKFSDKFSMDLYINLASLTWFSLQPNGGWNTHAWGLDANFSAQDINTHLTNFSIGFNYHF